MTLSHTTTLPRAADASMATSLVDDYREKGYLVVADALTSEEIGQLRAETARICRGARGSLRNGLTHSPQESDEEVIRQYLCIHFPHKISPLMRAQLAHPAIVRVLTQIIGPDVKCMQSMLFIKSAGKPGQAWHQDEDFIPTRDRSLTGAWLALDDASVENGCLWVLPGSHQHGVLWPLEQQDDPRFDCTDESQGFPWRDGDAVPVEVRAGSIVFFNGYLLHRSLPNRARSGHRRALVNHYMSAQSLLPWTQFAEGTYAATADYRDIVMVAGEDPYAWKGTTDVARPSVRPSGEGGCAR
ncbi:MAG: phytanoyl-CoA dioxygenase family protein [Anaerolineae bacterium]|nr:phytanoyl-CoA dioxygenase family protein [Anaerolineae bacterium]